jgi:hypothetical protein
MSSQVFESWQVVQSSAQNSDYIDLAAPSVWLLLPGSGPAPGLRTYHWKTGIVTDDTITQINRTPKFSATASNVNIPLLATIGEDEITVVLSTQGNRADATRDVVEWRAVSVPIDARH